MLAATRSARFWGPRLSLMLNRSFATGYGTGGGLLDSFVSSDIIDMRSDTVTQPTAEMRAAMAQAVVGDDVFGEDPTVIELEQTAASLFGKEAALFVPSGTMGNQLAILGHTRGEFGAEMIAGDKQHTYLYEQGGSASIAGVHTWVVPNAADGTFSLADVEAAIRPDDEHYPSTRLISVENTHNRCGGVPLSLDFMDAVGTLCQRRGLAFHVDGARVGNAAAALGVPLDRLCRAADSVSCCLSKGLAAPVGSVLVGSADLIRSARRGRKALGGGMRQAGILAAAGLISLRVMLPRLHEDHARMQRLVAELSGVHASIRLDPSSVHTNIAFFDVEGGRAATLVDTLASEYGVRLIAYSEDTVRICAHYQIGDDEVERVVDAVRAVTRRW